MLYIIGMGLHSYKDISLRSLNILKNADKIYFENYTSIQQEPITQLEDYLKKTIIICNRDIVESEDLFFNEARNHTVVILMAGSPMFATTHIGFLVTARKMKVRVEIIHNASILNIYGSIGLYSYNHGKTVSIPYFTDNWKPTSFLDNILSNINMNLHTLCLLDIKVDENRFMSVNEAIIQILSLKNEIITEEYKIFAICRFGSPDQTIKYGRMGDLLKINFGKPLHSLVIPGKMDTIEKEMVKELFKK